MKRFYKTKGWNFFVFAVLYLPAYFNLFPFADLLDKGLKLFIGLVTAVLCILTRSRPDRYVLGVVVLETGLFLITLHNTGSTLYFPSLLTLSTAVLHIMLMARIAPAALLKGASLYFSLITTVNTAMVLLFPDGFIRVFDEAGGRMNDYFLLGFDNPSTPVYFTALMLSLLCALYLYGRVTGGFALVLVSFLVFAACRQVATAVIGAGVFVVLGLLWALRLDRLITAKRLLITSVAVQVMMFSFSSEALNGLINDFLFGKADSLLGRINMWRIYLQNMKGHLLTGYGYTDNAKFAGLHGLPFYLATGNTHNTFLEVLYKGGVILFLLCAALLFLVMKKCDQTEDARKGRLVGMLIFSFLVRGFVEGGQAWMFLFLSFAFYIDRFQLIVPCRGGPGIKFTWNGGKRQR